VRTRTQFSAEELQVRAEAARQQRVDAGISDPVEAMQGPAPAFDQQLVGKRIEVRSPILSTCLASLHL
jgi:hypothetical protein